MTVRELFTPCPRTKTQDFDPFGVIPFPILSPAPAASNILLINYATSIYLSNCNFLSTLQPFRQWNDCRSLLKMTITLFKPYVNPQPDLKILLLLTIGNSSDLQHLYPAAVRFIHTVFIIADANKQYFPAISFQCFRIIPVFDLRNGCMRGFFIF